MPDMIEFWVDGGAIAFVNSSHAPDRGDKVNIRKVTYRVIGRTYALDQADEPRQRQMVCIINLEIDDDT